MNLIKKIGQIGIVMLAMASTICFAAGSLWDIDVLIGNQIAGENVQYSIIGKIPFAKVNLELVKPDGVKINFTGMTDQEGKLTGHFDSYHVIKAGDYQLSVYYASLGSKDVKSFSFTVLANELDVEKSTISSDDLVLTANGVDKAEVVVRILDFYGNPIVGKPISLVSSRSIDQIKTIDSVSNSAGVAKFEVSSNKSGLISLTAIEKSTGVILDQRLNLNAITANQTSFNLFQTAHAAEVGSIAGFEFENFPETIKPNQNVTFKVRAVDSAKQTVKDYSGTIRFASDKDQVVLPLDYKFIASDLGEHQFNLGLSFKTAGTYKLQVVDTADKNIIGEKTIVVSEESTATPTAGSSAEAVLSSPVSGKYASAVQTISGKGRSGAAIKIYNNNNFIGDAVAGFEGKFTYKSPALPDGKNEIYFTVVDAITNQVVATSNKVVLEIDTKAPVIDEIKLTPDQGVKTGDKVVIGVYSEADLSQAGAVFNGDVVILESSIDDATYYTGEIAAPTTPGKYDVQIVLADELGNEITYDDKLSIQVDATGVKIDNKVKDPTEVKPEPDKNPPTTEPNTETKSGVPTDVNGLLAYPSNNRVTLVWNAAQDDKAVVNYKIYFGSEIKDLKNVVATKNASTTWYIPNLENGKQYYFSVVAVDEDGQESVNRSELVSSIPVKLEIDTAKPEKPTQSIDESGLKPSAYDGPYPANSPKTGPELLFLILPSALGGAMMLKKKKKN